MPLYEIKAPDGGTFIVDGDHEPTPAEAENIWKTTKFLGGAPSLKPSIAPKAPVAQPEPAVANAAEYPSWSARPGGVGAFSRVVSEGPGNVMNFLGDPSMASLGKIGDSFRDAGTAATAAAPTAVRVGLPVAAAAMGNPIPAVMAAGGLGDIAAQSMENPGQAPNLTQAAITGIASPAGARALAPGVSMLEGAAQGVIEGATQSAASDTAKFATGQPLTGKEVVNNLLLSAATGGLLRGGEAKFLAKVDTTLAKAGVAPVTAEVKPVITGEVASGTFTPPTAGAPSHPAAMMLSDILPGEKVSDYAARMMSKIRRTQSDSGAIGHDLTQTRDLLDKVLAQVNDVGATGTFQPKSIRPDLAIGGAANPMVFVNPEVVAQTNKQFVEIGSLLRDLRRTAATTADEATHTALGVTEKLFDQAAANMREARRTSGLTLAEYQKGVDGMRRSLAMMPETQDVVRRLPPWQSAVVNIGNGKFPAAFNDAVNFTRQNLFGLFSFGMDMVNNAAAVAVKAPGIAASDIASMAKGEPATRLAGLFKAVTSPKETFAIPDFMKAEMGATFNGEKSTMGNSLIDWTFAMPAKMKGAVDGYYANTFAAADLYSSALTEAKKKGLQGDAKDQFVSAFLRNPTDAAADSAIELGNKMKFNRKLSDVEEKIAGSTGVKLFADAFPRWSFQFSRWMAESLGADPKMIKAIREGTATSPQVADYVATTAAGWGGVALVNQTLYDHTDFSTMEYVREDGRRIRLSNLSPLPDALMLNAAMRGDEEKFKSAIRFSSMIGSQVRLKGLLSDLLNTTAQSLSGDNTGATIGREMTKFANSLIPGQAVLGALKALHDPVMREGFGANVPIVSEQLPIRYNVTSGEPMTNEQDVGDSHFVGINIPMASRDLNPVEKAFLNHGLGLRRPGRTTLLNIPAPDVPKELTQQYEKAVGVHTKELVEPLVKDPDFNALPFDARQKILQRYQEAANKMAKADLIEKKGDIQEKQKVTPFDTRLLPEYLRR